MPARLKAREICAKPRGPIVDLTGQRFGSLVALRVYGMRGRRTYWLCQCECGSTTRVAMGNLRWGGTKSCGCGLGMNRQPAKPAEHKWWLGVVQHETVFSDFEAFLDYVGERPSQRHRLRRPNPGQPFGPGNCEWSLLHSQARLIEFRGVTLNVSEWAARLGISKQALSQRLAKYDLETALTTVKMKPGPRKG